MLFDTGANKYIYRLDRILTLENVFGLIGICYVSKTKTVAE